MTQGLALGVGRVPNVAPGRRQNSSLARTSPAASLARHSWPVTRHFLGLPVGFGQGELPGPVRNYWQSALHKAAGGNAGAHPRHASPIPEHPLLKAHDIAPTPVSRLSCAGSLIRVLSHVSLLHEEGGYTCVEVRDHESVCVCVCE